MFFTIFSFCRPWKPMALPVPMLRARWHDISDTLLHLHPTLWNPNVSVRILPRPIQWQRSNTNLVDGASFHGRRLG